MLNGYMDIFSDMLKKAKTVETETSLKELQESVKELKNKYNNEQAVWKQLHEINTVKVRKIFFLMSLWFLLYTCLATPFKFLIAPWLASPALFKNVHKLFSNYSLLIVHICIYKSEEMISSKI